MEGIENMESFLIFLLAISSFLLVLALISYVICVIGTWKIFSKAGEAGWKSLIPVYNNYILYKISWNTKAFWIFLAITLVSTLLAYTEESLLTMAASLLSIVAYVINIMQLHRLSRAFGHGILFTLGLLFLNPVFLLILGFDRSRYMGRQESL